MKTKITQKKIAEKAGLSPEFLCKVLSGQQNISKPNSVKAALALSQLGISTSWQDWLINPQRIKGLVRQHNRSCRDIKKTLDNLENTFTRPITPMQAQQPRVEGNPDYSLSRAKRENINTTWWDSSDPTVI